MIIKINMQFSQLRIKEMTFHRGNEQSCVLPILIRTQTLLPFILKHTTSSFAPIIITIAALTDDQWVLVYFFSQEDSQSCVYAMLSYHKHILLLLPNTIQLWQGVASLMCFYNEFTGNIKDWPGQPGHFSWFGSACSHRETSSYALSNTAMK